MGLRQLLVTCIKWDQFLVWCWRIIFTSISPWRFRTLYLRLWSCGSHMWQWAVCVHGTYKKNLESIVEHGLKRMKRLHVHFSCGLPTDGEVISGKIHIRSWICCHLQNSQVHAFVVNPPTQFFFLWLEYSSWSGRTVTWCTFNNHSLQFLWFWAFWSAFFLWPLISNSYQQRTLAFQHFSWTKTVLVCSGD